MKTETENKTKNLETQQEDNQITELSDKDLDNVVGGAGGDSDTTKQQNKNTCFASAFA